MQAYVKAIACALCLLLSAHACLLVFAPRYSFASRLASFAPTRALPFSCYPVSRPAPMSFFSCFALALASSVLLLHIPQVITKPLRLFASLSSFGVRTVPVPLLSPLVLFIAAA
eukprot:3779851-Pleurochrysis_carterae.AAC.3